MNIPKIDQSTKIIILVGFLAGILSCLTLGDAVFYKEAPVVHAINPDSENISRINAGDMVNTNALIESTMLADRARAEAAAANTSAGTTYYGYSDAPATVGGNIETEIASGMYGSGIKC